MTTFELARKLLEYPPETVVVQSCDWQEPEIVEEYLGIEEDPALCFKIKSLPS